MGGDGPLVVVRVGDSREAVAVELVGGLGDRGGAGGDGLGVDGVAVRDVEVDEAAGVGLHLSCLCESVGANAPGCRSAI